MIENKLSAKKRPETGKGPARRLRMKEELPAVIYSKGRDATPVVICPREASKILHGPLRRNTLIEMSVEGESKKRTVMVKERQIHPTRRSLVHIDFAEVSLNEPVTVAIPVKLFGKSEAITLGGKLDHVLQKIRVSCLPNAIPEVINIDISPLPFGSTHTKDVPLPEGLKLAEKPRVVVLTIKKPRGAAKEEEAAQAQGAAPAKAAAKPKAK